MIFLMVNSMENHTIDSSAQLIERLKTLGVDDISTDTLRRWSHQGIIPAYTTYYKRRPKKRAGRPPKPGSKAAKKLEEREREREKKKGRPGLHSRWPSETVEEAAAV